MHLKSKQIFNRALFKSIHWRTGIVVILAACIHCACRRADPSPASPMPDTGNSAAAYLKNAERQSETDEQRREIQRALRDMLDRSPTVLRQARYADYAGQTKAWSITDLLEHYFVPNPLSTLNHQRFFEEIRAPAARAAIQHQLDEINRALR